jgi:hypothetical protein
MQATAVAVSATGRFAAPWRRYSRSYLSACVVTLAHCCPAGA